MLEQIVRPYQSPGLIADKAVPVTRVVVATPELAIIRWGAPGQAPSSTGVSFKVKDTDTQLKEVSRSTTNVRVQNPDDSNQYVVEQRIDKIAFKGLKTPTQSDNNSGQAGGVDTNTAYATPPLQTENVDNPVVTENVSNPVQKDTTQYYTLVQSP